MIDAETEKRLKRIEEYIGLQGGITEPPTDERRSSIVGPFIDEPTEEVEEPLKEEPVSYFDDLRDDVYEIIKEYIGNDNNTGDFVRHIRSVVQFRRTYAKITQSLTRGNAESGTAPINTYRIELLGLAATPEWVAGTTYPTGYYVKVSTSSPVVYYRCKKGHTSNNDDKKYTNTTFWEEYSEHGLIAYVDGYDDDLLRTVPWFVVGQIVQVVERQDYDASGNPVGNKKWRILETVFTAEKIEAGGTYRYSVAWLEDKKRVAAVFA